MKNKKVISGIILASGFSERMGRDKLLCNIDGVPLVERVVKAARGSRLDEILMVYRSAAVKEIAGRYDIKTVYNDRAGEGQSAAIKKGLEAASPDMTAFMFMVGDQPFLDTDTIDTLIDTFTAGKHKIVVPVYAGRRGNPVIFAASLKQMLLGIAGDKGGRVIIEKMSGQVQEVAIDQARLGIDIDTESDYRKYT